MSSRQRQQFQQLLQQQQQQHAANVGLLTTVTRLADSQYAANVAAQAHARPAAATSASAAAADESNEFTRIISDMMCGFGDCGRPLDDTVALVERILLQQLRAILNALIDSAMRRCGRPQPTRVDFEFLMRKNPIKLYRLRQHIRDLQIKRKYEELHHTRANILQQLSKGDLDTGGAPQPSTDENAKLEKRYDEEKVRRMFRADRISQQLNGEEYARYNDARQASFSSRSAPRIRLRLRRWLGAEYELSNEVFTLLSYLAHETVAVIVDYAILTRLDSDNRSNEPLERAVSTRSSHTLLHLCPEVTQGRGMDGLQPVTVAEVNEAMRRVAQGASKTLGMHRQSAGRPAMPILAF